MTSTRRSLSAIAWVFLAWSCSSSSSEPEPPYWPWGRQGPVGAEALTALDALPRLRRGVHTVEFSSYDREGYNDNGFSGVEEQLYVDEDGASVLVELTGPGAIYDLYLGWLNTNVTDEQEADLVRQLGNLQVFLDDDEFPRIDLAPSAFFDKQHPPFLGPLVFDGRESALGSVSYVPIPFAESCRIRLTAGPRPMWFYQIWAQQWREPEGAVSFTGQEDLSRARAMLANVGADPKDAAVRSSNRRHTGQLALAAPNGSDTQGLLFEQRHGGRIQSLHLGPIASTTAGVNLLRQLWIEMEWDGQVSVSAQLALFFATGHRTDPAGTLPQAAEVRSVPVRGLFAGEDADGRLYSYFPMPFSRSARIGLRYRTAGTNGETLAPVSIPYAVEVHDLRSGENPGTTEGYFRTQHRSVSRGEFEDPSSLGRDYVILDARGHGHYVGLVMLADDTQEIFLEGDERVYVDGSLTPRIIGTATETFFQGGWYFGERPFSLPLHGAPVIVLREGEAFGKIDLTMYRWHPTDGIPFYDSIRFGIQHGGINNLPVNYETLAFYYAVDDPLLVPSDAVDVGDPGSERDHDFRGSQPLPAAVALTAYYEGDRDGSLVGDFAEASLADLTPQQASNLNLRLILDPPETPPAEESAESVTDDGRVFNDAHRFTVRIDPGNDGVKIRRRFDQAQPRQAARVRVDGEEAGLWSYAGANPFKRWRDDDFEIASRFTAGKSEIVLTIEPVQDGWTAHHYWIFTYLER